MQNAFGNDVDFFKIPNNIDLNFNEIYFLHNENNIWKEDKIMVDSLKSKNHNDGVLTIKEQLWIIFNSGIDFSDISCLNRNNSGYFYLEIRGENFYNCKRIDFGNVPDFLKELIFELNPK